MARPTKYTPEAAERILSVIRQGMPFKHAAAYGGVSEPTFSRWRKNIVGFDDAVKSAEAEAIAGRLVRIRTAEDDHWQAAAWWLERRYPDDFGRRVEDHHITGKHDITVRVEYTDASEDRSK